MVVFLNPTGLMERSQSHRIAGSITGRGRLGSLATRPGRLECSTSCSTSCWKLRRLVLRRPYEMDTADALRRVDERNVRLHPGDAGLAVLVLRGVSDLERATKRLDDTRRGLQVFGFILAVISTAATVTSVVQAF